MARSQTLVIGKLIVFALLAVVVCGPASLAQDADDDFVAELRRQRLREKAIREGKDPDVVVVAEVAAPKPKLPATATGWMSAVQRRWNSDKDADVTVVRESVDALKTAIGDEADLRERVFKNFNGFKEEEAEKQLTVAVRKSGATVDKLRTVLESNRPAALRAIMDPAWTSADGYSKTPEVEAAVGKLFAVWRDPIGYAIEHHKLDLATPAARLDKLAAMLGEIAPELGTWPDGAANAEAYMRHIGIDVLNVKEKEYKANSGVLLANIRLQGGTLTEEDKRHVRVLNDYRMMLGRSALTINLPLCRAAHGHSKYMNEIKQLAHNIDGHPEGRTPQDRAKRAGYSGPVAENCLVGTEDGDAAVWQWWRSPDHHRNMIGNHSVIGVGHDGTYWTQKFGGGGAPRGR